MTFYADLAGLFYDALKGNPVELHQIPVASKIVRKGDSLTEEMRYNQEYFHYVDWVKGMDHKYRGYEKLVKEPEYRDKYRGVIKSPEFKDYLFAKSQIETIKGLNENNEEKAFEIKKKVYTRYVQKRR